MNTHSLIEPDYENKLKKFADAVYDEQPDIIAMQEVNQTASEKAVPEGELDGYFACSEGTVIKKDNHAYNTVKMLGNMGADYYWTWLAIKNGYDKFEEGIALLSKSQIIETDVHLISRADNFFDWKTRKILGIKTKACPEEYFYSVHMGWWADADEPFENQWSNILEHLKGKKSVWLMGDFNCSDNVKNEGYDLISSSGFYDTFNLSNKHDSGITVEKLIDGWKDKLSKTDGMRIDYIWCRKKAGIKESKVIFNGKNKPVVSDHYGVTVSF